MMLADPPAAADRFAPYAAMSALAYAEDTDCGNATPKITPMQRSSLVEYLTKRGWEETSSVQWVPPCEDDVGLFIRVWKRDSDTREVVIAFRGTWGYKDWVYGNSHWLTRFLPMEDQYSRARAAVERVFDRFSQDTPSATRFVATGHSLGGGLAQHALYSYPGKIAQAIAFDPSSATGFAEQSIENQIAACECNNSELKNEPRIFRVYDAYEILSNLRIFHKIFLPPERHIHEVRFPNAASHSMIGLAEYLIRTAGSSNSYSVPWFSGTGTRASNQSCTAEFARSQRTSCEAIVTKDQWNKCPQ